MIFIDFLVMIALGGGTVIGFTMLRDWIDHRATKRAIGERERQTMLKDLHQALEANDYRKLENWLVVYADKATPDHKAMVTQRRNELFLEHTAEQA